MPLFSCVCSCWLWYVVAFPNISVFKVFSDTHFVTKESYVSEVFNVVSVK